MKGRGTIIQTAAFNSQIEIVELLLERRPRLDRMPNEWGGVLAAAAGWTSFQNQERWTKVALILLERGASIRDDDAECGSALANAARWNNLNLAKTLIERGANVNAVNRGRKVTALQEAASGGSYDMVKLILECGASMDVCDDAEKSFIALAVTSYTRGWDIDSEKFEEAKRSIELLLLHGAGIDDQKGSALRTAVLKGNEEMVTFILEKGASINHQDWQPDALRLDLRHCERRGAREALRALLKSWGAVSVDQASQTPASSSFEEKAKPSDPGVLPTAPLNEIFGGRRTSDSPQLSQDIPLNAALGIQGSDHSKIYRQIRILGNGSAGSVDVVTCARADAGEGDMIFARKMFWYSPNIRTNEKQHQKAANEIRILQRLRHHHMIEFVAAYTTGSQIGIVMSPVADTDLAKYLASINQAKSFNAATLTGWFGCLAAGSSYLHAQGIRHKDIQPGESFDQG